MRRDCSPGRCRNKKGLSGCSPAEPGSEMCVALCGGGCRAGSGKAKLIPLPQEMKGVPSQEFRRWVFDKIDLSNSCIYQSKRGRSAKAERPPPAVCSVWRRNCLVLTDFQVDFLFPFLLCIHGWCSIGSHCLSSDQILLFLLSASSARAGLWQSRLWILLLAWSQGDAEKLTSEATVVTGITALLGTTLASLSFPLQHF